MYGKLFASCFTGSMSGSGADMFAVWAYVLANSDMNGTVELNPKLIAVMIGMPEDNVKAVLEKLQQPDPNSRSREQDGKRLIRHGEFLYEIVNYLFYRAIQNKKAQTEYMRKYMKEKRDRERIVLLKCANVNNVSTTVNNVSTQVEEEVEVDREVEGEEEVKEEGKGDCKGGKPFSESIIGSKEKRAALRKQAGI
jgi:hypothetical protein